MLAKAPKPRPEPVPAAVLIERLQALVGRKVVRTNQIIASLRAPDVDWLPADLETISALLEELDSTWTARLAVVTRPLPSRRSDLAKRLGAQLVALARQRTEYPNGEASLGPPSSWIAERMGVQPDGTRPLPLLLVALWPDRAHPWFGRVAFELLRLWSKSAKAESSPGSVAVALALLGRSGQIRARQIITFGREFEVEARKAQLLGDEAVSERDRARRARESAESMLRERERDLDLTRTELATLKTTLAEQAATSARLLEAADAASRAQRTQARNELASMRRRVREVLTREVEEIDLYLDRPTPNVDGARARVGNLRELNSELAATGEEG